MQEQQTDDQSHGSNEKLETGEYETGCSLALFSLLGMFASLCGGSLTIGGNSVWTIVAIAPLCLCVAGIVAGLVIHYRDPNYEAKKKRDEKVALADARARSKKKLARERREERTHLQEERKFRELEFGPVHPKLLCPHCQKKGTVRTKKTKRKKGVSGAKATGALLTGGLSILVTGLSRKEDETRAHCDNCDCTWHF
jgi:hypothetical protein